MTPFPKISRRKFVLLSAAALTLAAGTGAVQWALDEPAYPTPTLKLSKENVMNPRILVAYGSKCGSTAEIAQAVAAVLSQRGYSVDLQSVRQVKRLANVDALVLGTALRFEAPVNETTDFVKKFRSELQTLPTALFSAGVYMRDNTPEMRAKTRGFLQPIFDVIPEPLHLGLFAGKVDYQTLAPFWRFLVSKDSSGLMREGDWRDWDAIQRWAAEAADKFKL